MSRIEDAVFARLLALAHACQGVAPVEARLLARYRRALKARSPATPDTAAELPRLAVEALPAAERQDIVQMLLRVACADGVVSAPEAAILQHLASELGVGAITFANLRVAAEHDAEVHGHHHRRAARSVLLGGGVVAALLAVWWIWSGQLQADERALHARATELRRDLDDLRSAAHDPVAMLEHVAAGAHDSVFLLFCWYDLVTPRERRSFVRSGTGFLISPIGHLVTDRHVARAWEYDDESRRLVADGAVLDEASVVLAAWRSGTRFRRSAGAAMDLSSAQHSRNGTLRVLRVADDPDDDLALVQLTLGAPTWSLQLAHDVAPARLEEVIVVGFPAGINLLETDLVEPTPCTGRVSKVERNIIVDGTTVGGVSGGPLLNRQGRVIGVAKRSVQSTVGVFTTAGRVCSLLPVRELEAEAAPLRGRLAPGQWLDLVELLAAAQGTLDGTKEAERLRTGLRALEQLGAGADSGALCRELVRDFGVWWAAPAVVRLTARR